MFKFYNLKNMHSLDNSEKKNLMSAFRACDLPEGWRHVLSAHCGVVTVVHTRRPSRSGLREGFLLS